MTSLVVIAVSLFIIFNASTRLMKANRIYMKAMKDLKVMAERPRELAAQRVTLERGAREMLDYTAGVIRRTEALKLEKTELANQLEALQARKKEDLYALERIMQPGLELWEVEISNATFFDHLPAAEFKLSWAAGRNYLVVAPNEAEARRRAELKFFSSQGFRTGRVVKSKRFVPGTAA